MHLASWLAAVSIILTPAPARSSAMGIGLVELLTKAKTLSVVLIDEVSPRGGFSGKVVTRIRGPAVGTRVSCPSFATSEPLSRGETVLVACHPRACPVLGIAHGSFFLFAQHFTPGVPAPLLVMPGAVEQRAVAPLAGGKKVEKLCLRLTARFFGKPAESTQFDLQVAPQDGKGTARGPLLGRAAWPAEASFSLSAQKTLLLSASVIRTTNGEHIPFHLFGWALKRSAAGCYLSDVYPGAPLARDLPALTRMLRGPIGKAALAQGAIQLDPGGPLKPGRYPVRLTTSDGGSSPLFLHSAIGGRALERMVQRVDNDRTRSRVEFPLTRSNQSPSYPQLLFELGNLTALPTEIGEHADLAFRMAGGKKLTSPLYLQRDEGAKPTTIGTITLEPSP